MAVQVSKTDGESTERCITRFNKKVQAARFVMMLKKSRYFKKKLTKRQTRTAAVMREMYRAKAAKQKFYS